MTSGLVIVVDSWYVAGPRTPQPYYAVVVKPASPAWAPTIRLITCDRGVYADCLGVEGLPIPVEVEYHRAGGAWVLDRVELEP